jgi:hypothetical protein
MSDWIKHDGGACPVDGETRVFIRWRLGDYEPPMPLLSWSLSWLHSGGDRDIIAYRLAEPNAEPQAHMMSAPDCVLPAACSSEFAQLKARKAMCTKTPWSLRAELDAKDDELVKWKYRALTAERRLRGITFTTNDQGDLVLISEQDSEGRIVRVMWEREEQLRKASDEANTSAPIPGPKTMVGIGALVATADALDPRLGIAQPEGEPCEPRPTRARWRAMV